MNCDIKTSLGHSPAPVPSRSQSWHQHDNTAWKICVCGHFAHALRTHVTAQISFVTLTIHHVATYVVLAHFVLTKSYLNLRGTRLWKTRKVWCPWNHRSDCGTLTREKSPPACKQVLEPHQNQETKTWGPIQSATKIRLAVSSVWSTRDPCLSLLDKHQRPFQDQTSLCAEASAERLCLSAVLIFDTLWLVTDQGGLAWREKLHFRIIWPAAAKAA